MLPLGRTVMRVISEEKLDQSKRPKPYLASFSLDWVDTLPPPIEAGDSSSWFSDRCHGFIHGLPQFPQAWIRPCHYLFAGSCCFLQYLPYQSFAFQSLIENVDCGIDISIMLRFAMRAFPVPYPEIFDGPILISASGTCLR